MLPTIKNYSIIELIYEGKHTIVLRAQRKSDKLPVVIKVLKSGSLIPKNVEQLTHEYDLLVKLNTSRVVKAYELVSIQNNLVMVMEDSHTLDLATLLEETDWDLLTSLEIAIEIAAAIGDIHHQHIIHKDIKPQNILVNPDKREIKIIDFGIASQLTREVQQALSPEQLEGSLAYIAPEQTGRLNRFVDYRADIYSLGMTLYQLFTKKLPFEANSPLELIHLHLAQQPLPPQSVNPLLPQVLSEIILKCLSKEAEHRYHSAFGLKNDLLRCREEFLKTSNISYFKPGEKDIYDHFHFPEKLYGRNKEINFLIQCFNEARGDKAILLTLNGYSGVGKSSLVLEAQKTIINKNGRFIFAKFDQFKRTIPYHGFIQAFQSLIQQILGESDESLKEWKKRMLAAIGDSGQVLADVIPEIKLIIGEPPVLARLSPQENVNRFKYILASFLKSLLSTEQTLVIFIDDFQWADDSSLRLLEQFFNDPTINNLLFITAYRDNEVSAFHPMVVTIHEISSKCGRVINLPIKPLSLEFIEDMIQDMYYGPPAQSKRLSEILHKKTQGNPFFTLQLIKALYEQNLFYFDKERNCWMAKLESIEAMQVSENVADLMVTKLKEMPSDLLEILKIGAALETRFDLDLIARVSQFSKETIKNSINLALQDDLIIQEKTLFGTEVYPKNNYRFLHDRVQQAAYSLLSEKEKEELHYKIGHVILEATPEDKLLDRCIDIANHLNLMNIAKLSDEEKAILRKLNFMAGTKAKDSVAYLAAAQYFSHALKLLPEDAWETHYSETMELHKNLALCLQITGNAKHAEQLFQKGIDQAKTNLDKVELYFVSILLNSTMQEYDKCFNNAHAAMQLLNHDFRITPSKLTLVKDLIFHKVRMLFHNVEELETMPLATDPNVLAISGILVVLIYPAFVTGNKLLFLRNALTIVELSFKYGITPHTSPGLATLAMVLGSEMMKDYEGCSRYGETALHLAHRFPKTREVPGTTYIYYAFIHRWKNSLRSSVVPLKQNFRALLESGSGSLAAANAVYSNLIPLITGEKLDVVLENIIESIKEIKKYSSTAEEFSLMVHREVCLCLKGLTRDPTDPRPVELTDDNLSAKANIQNMLYFLRYMVWRTILLYTFRKYEEAKVVANQVLSYKDNFPNWIEWHLFYFYHALTLAATLHKPSDNSASWKLLKEHQKKLQRWARASPQNYEHPALLVEAEIYRIEGNHEKTLDAFERAVIAARKAECPQDIALTYELFAKYYLQRNLNEMAALLLRKSLQYYSQWGAEAKCLDFKNTYAEFLTLETLAISSFDLHDLPFLTTTAGTVSTETPITTSSSPSRSSSISHDVHKTEDSFDIDALIDASQALSKEIVFENVMESLMHIVMVHSGADKAFLILMQNENPEIVAEQEMNQKFIPLLTPIPLDLKSDELPLTIVKYVLRTNTVVLLNNAPEEGNFRYDPYVLHNKPKSILCLPLLKKGTLSGILYLENKVSPGAFTPKRIRLLALLTSQIAISIENAQFYGKLEGKVNERTKALQQRNQELQHALQTIKTVQTQMIQQEKMASLGLLTSGIAHELKNPLNFVINFSQVAQEHLEELIKEIRLQTIKPEKLLLDIQEVANTLKKVDFHGRRADSIIRGMLAHAHQGSAKPETIDLHLLIEQALNLIFHSYRKKDSRFNVNIVKQFDPLVTTIHGYPSDLIRVFINIFDNSCYAILDKIIREGGGYQPELLVSTVKEGEQVKISIRDNGPGISPDIIGQIFNPFFTTKPAGTGTGLGLSIIYDIITKQHQGNISVASNLGEFSEFTISLNVKDQ